MKCKVKVKEIRTFVSAYFEAENELDALSKYENPFRLPLNVRGI